MQHFGKLPWDLIDDGQVTEIPFSGNTKNEMMLLMLRSIMLEFAVFALGSISHGIAQTAGYYPKGGADIGAEDVSLIQLIANPETYDGKTVRITGFLHLEFEGNVIYLHSEDFRYGLTKNGLWFEIPKDMSKEQMKAVNDQYVICTARFIAKMHGHMGLNNGEVANVTRLKSGLQTRDRQRSERLSEPPSLTKSVGLPSPFRANALASACPTLPAPKIA